MTSRPDKALLSLDGYVIAKVPLNDIRLLDPEELLDRIAGPEAIRYARFADSIANGHYANGVPIVYRNPRGAMIASDLRRSDLAIYAEQNVKVHPGVPRDPVNPQISVKIIEVSGRDDIAVQRAAYLAKNT